MDAETFAVPSDQHSDDEMDDRISIHAFHEECDNLSGVMRLSEVTRGYSEPTRAQMPQNGEKLVFSSSRLNKIFIILQCLFCIEDEKRRASALRKQFRTHGVLTVPA